MKQVFKFKKLLGFGGYYTYFISNNNKFFIKVCKGDRELILQEFLNLKKYWNKLGIEQFNLVEPIKYSEKEEFLITRNIEAKPLSRILNPKTYYFLGKKLKEFHNKGFSHGHLEFNDILFKNGNFFLVDIPFFNKHKSIDDVITLKLSLNMFKIKQPWLWYKYTICNKAFFRGYHIIDSTNFEQQYIKLTEQRIEFLLRRNDYFSKFKGYFLKLGMKLKLI